VKLRPRFPLTASFTDSPIIRAAVANAGDLVGIEGRPAQLAAPYC